MSQSPFVTLSRNIFYAAPSTESAIEKFYTKQIGMAKIDCNVKDSAVYNFDSKKLNPAAQQFIYSSSFKSSKQESKPAYWKIGLTMANLDEYRNTLVKEHGINVSNAQQFEDIGYLCHLSDPMGNGLELLQHTMKMGNNKNNDNKVNDKKGSSHGTCTGQITIRISKEKESFFFYQNILGMQLLSVQKVNKYNFVLYFFGYNNIKSNDENDSKENENKNKNDNGFKSMVESREWLWQQPYTTLEFVYNYGKSEYALPQENELGWQGIVIESIWTPQETLDYLKSKCYQYDIKFDCKQLDSQKDQIARCIIGTNAKESVVKIKDPSGNPIFIHCKPDKKLG